MDNAINKILEKEWEWINSLKNKYKDQGSIGVVREG
jgi:hypothetical protein